MFYLYPPYWGAEADYGRDAFMRADFAQLAADLIIMDGNITRHGGPRLL